MRVRLSLLIVSVLFFMSVVSTGAQHSVRPTGYNIRYAEAIDRSLMLDVYEPEGEAAAPYPVVLMFHGAPGDKGDVASLSIPQIVVGAGYAAVAVTYTTRLPAAYTDALCAIGWVYENAEQYHLDTSRIAVFGLSFGGLVVAEIGAIDDPALYAANCPNALPDDYALRGVVGDAGLFLPSVDEIVVSLEDAPEETVDIPTDTLGQTLDMLRATPANEWRDLDLPDDVRTFLEYFPIYWVNGSEPPHLLIHGIGDSVVSYQQSLDYAQVLLQQRVNVTLVFDRLSGHVPPPRVYDTELATFLHRIFD